MGDNGGIAGGAVRDIGVNQVTLVTHSRNLPGVDGKMLLKEDSQTFFRAYDAYCVVLRMIGLQA